jgi:hypothetical protein
MLKIFIMMVLLQSCSTPQHIRSENFYHSDWSTASFLVNKKKTQEALEKHPIFTDTKSENEQTLNYFVFGNFPRVQTLSVEKICQDKEFAEAYIDHSFPQAMISFFTIGIYTPRTAKVWCYEKN